MIVFVHIERTGGTTIHDALKPHFPGRHVVFDGLVDIVGGLESALRQPGRDWYVGGHVRFGELGPILQNWGASDVLFSTTRDPLERIVSLYFFTKKHPEALPGVAPYADQRFDEFYAAAADLGLIPANSQCQWLAASTSWQETVKTIRRHYDAVGVHWYYGEFLGRLEDLLQEAVPGLTFDGRRSNAAYHGCNPDGSWSRKFEISELVDARTRRRIERDQEGDYALVEYIAAQPGAVLGGGWQETAGSRERRWFGRVRGWLR